MTICAEKGEKEVLVPKKKKNAKLTCKLSEHLA
jgi:hypothetical protein